MASTAQALANRANAQLSTGPTSPEGKTRSSENAQKFGLFSRRDAVPAESALAHAELTDDLLTQLKPQTRLEEVLVREIISASWRLERCAQIEANDPASPEHPAVERARASANRILKNCLTELRKLQGTRTINAVLQPDLPETDASCLAPLPDVMKAKKLQMETRSAKANARLNSWLLSPPVITKPRVSPDLQNEPTATNQTQTPRTAPCPCGSGQKYKRCCGIGAPPVIGATL